MKNPVKIIAYSVGVTVLTSTIALSCGMRFPWQLLDNRSYTMSTMAIPSSDFDSATSGDFMDRLSLILPINPKEKHNFLQGKENYKKEHPNSVSWMYDKNISKTICDATGSDYRQAAILFHERHFEEASQKFEILSKQGSPVEQVCAMYGLARVLEKMPGNGVSNAIKTYVATIELVADKGIDPFDLGISAYGQAARLILEQGDPNSKTGIAGMVPLGNLSQDGLKFEIGNIQKGSVAQLHRGLYYYVKQALLGEETGKPSVVIIVRGLTDPHNPNAKLLLDQSIKDPFIRKVILAFVLNNDLFYQADDPKIVQNVFDSFVKAIDSHLDMGDDWGSLAAFAYQHRDMKKAQLFAEQGMKSKPQAISAWVLAKIALMNNQKEKAQEYYHQAIGLLNDKTLVLAEKNKIQGEQSVLTLSKGDFVQALEQLWPVRDQYWGDVIYLAETVLTLDELKQFVDKYTVIPTEQLIPESMNGYSPLQYKAFLLRDLLARRLQREGRGEEALIYYLDPKIKQTATDYLTARQAIEQKKSSIEQAHAMWDAAQLMRWKGMEIVGTDGYPDYAPGDIFGGYSQSPDNLDDENNRRWSVPAERQRINASWVKPDKRFHYRYLAANEAVKAASLLPPRSQAYAAILCHANGWMQRTIVFAQEYDKQSNSFKTTPTLAEQTAKDIYAIYVKNGAIVPFATHFGYDCPQPNFETIPLTQFKVMTQNIYDYLYQFKHHMVKPQNVAQ